MTAADEIFIGIAVGCYFLMTLTLAGNLLYLRRRPVQESTGEPLLSILIPARNEATNLRRLLPTLASQNYPNVEVIVYDDDSTDRTWEVIQQHQGGRISGIRGSELPNGWIGKCHALHQAANKSRGDILMFLDADVLIEHDGVIGELVARFLALPPFSAMTIMPGLHPSGGRLLVSLIPNSILLTIPWFLTRYLRIPAMAMLNGQCWMIHVEDYLTLEPHKARRSAILEDVAIGRDLTRAGMSIHLLATKGHIDVRMYDTIEEAWRGFRKNAYLLFGGSPLVFILLQLPFILLFFVAPLLEPLLFAWMILLKFGTDKVAGFKAIFALLAPVSYVLALALDWDSAIHHWRGKVEWKGRPVS